MRSSVTSPSEGGALVMRTSGVPAAAAAASFARTVSTRSPGAVGMSESRSRPNVTARSDSFAKVIGSKGGRAVGRSAGFDFLLFSPDTAPPRRNKHRRAQRAVASLLENAPDFLPQRPKAASAPAGLAGGGGRRRVGALRRWGQRERLGGRRLQGCRRLRRGPVVP